jgi:hypothetical protein
MKKTVIVSFVFLIALGTFQYLFSSVQQSELTTKIVSIKYIEHSLAINLLRRYLRGPNETISQLPGTSRLVIEAAPETIEKIISILNEIDIKPIDLQFNVDLLLGSAGTEEENALTPEVKSDSVLRELSSLLKYRSFQRLDSAIIKVQDNKYSQQKLGGSISLRRDQKDLGRQPVSLRLNLRPRYIKEDKKDMFNVELNLYQLHGFAAEGKERVSTLINTTLTLKSGERTVVGVSKLNGGDKALILIVSGEVIR